MKVRFPVVFAAVCGAGWMTAIGACTLWNGVNPPADASAPAAPTEASVADAQTGVAAYAAEVLADEPIAYWRFAALSDPKSMTVRDVTAHGKTCHLPANAFLVETGPFDGSHGLHIEPASGGVACSEASDPDFAFTGHAPFAFEFFVTLGGDAPGLFYYELFDRLAQIGDTNHRAGYDAYLASSGGGWILGLDQWRDGGPPDGVKTTSSLSMKGWFHVIITRDGTGETALFINGAKQDEELTAPTVDGNMPLVLGGNKVGSSLTNFKGDVAEFAVYAKALGTSDATRHVNAAVQCGFVLP